MSRHEIRTPEHTIVLGWDPPLETYFAQVWIGEPESEANVHEGYRALGPVPLIWVGVSSQEIPTVEALSECLLPYAEVPADILHRLCSDRTVDEPATFNTTIDGVYRRNFENLEKLLDRGGYNRIQPAGYLPLTVEKDDALPIVWLTRGDVGQDPASVTTIGFRINAERATPFYLHEAFQEHFITNGKYAGVPLKSDRQEELDKLVKTWWQDLHSCGYWQEAARLHDLEQGHHLENEPSASATNDETLADASTITPEDIETDAGYLRDRAEDFGKHLGDYLDGDEYEAGLVSLLTDAQHWAAHHQLDFAHCLELAEKQHTNEVRDERRSVAVKPGQPTQDKHYTVEVLAAAHLRGEVEVDARSDEEAEELALLAAPDSVHWYDYDIEERSTRVLRENRVPVEYSEEAFHQDPKNPYRQKGELVSKASERAADDFLTSLKPEDVPYELAYNAHRGTSFDPDKRAKQDQQHYVNHMHGVHHKLVKLADTPDKQTVVAHELERYRQSWLEKYKEFLHAESRVVSPMISGSSNFPVARMEKLRGWADKRLTELLNFEERALAAMVRTVAPERGPITSADADAVQKLQTKLAKLEETQALYKEINKAHAQFLKNPASLDRSDLPEQVKETIRTYTPRYSWEPHPVPPYQLQNNNAEIRRVRNRIAEVSKMQASPYAETAYTNGIRVVENPEAGRIQVFFPDKPDRHTIDLMKHSGFRWSPTQEAWQRYLNNAGRQAAESVMMQLGKEKVEIIPAEPNDSIIESTLSIRSTSGQTNEPNQEPTARPAEVSEAAEPHLISGETKASDPITEKQSSPLYDIRSDRVRALIWDCRGPNGEASYTFSLARSYKDKDGNWQRTSSYDPPDLPHLQAVLDKARTIFTEELGQNMTQDVKVTRKEEAKQGPKQTL